jgi:hypothetical protein
MMGRQGAAMSILRFPLYGLWAAAALALGSCSMLDLVESSPAPESAAGPEPAYRQIASREIKAILGDPAKAGTLEISRPRLIDALKGRSWLFCLKGEAAADAPRYYAVFIQSGKIVDSRAAVVLDRCEQQDYSAFDLRAEAHSSAS